MASFNNTSKTTTRIHALEQERKKRSEDVERRRENITGGTSSLSSNTSRKTIVTNSGGLNEESDVVTNFAAPSTVNNELLGNDDDTIGLVTHDDFKARRLQNVQRMQREKEKAELTYHRNRQTLEKRKRANKAVLSFQQNDDDISDSDSNDDDDDDDEKDKKYLKKRKTILGKNPNVDTKFLPDKQRENEQRLERERLKQRWIKQQEEIKNEWINITYSYWDGSGHRRMLKCKKGTTIGRFLSMVQMEFKQLRNIPIDSLMYIKEDLIIPHHYSFYDFVVMKVRGKSGPLFQFDVIEDIRVVDDRTKEKEDTHASKVVERRWYERNKHIFPASRWEVYDPSKKYDRYTIHGDD